MKKFKEEIISVFKSLKEAEDFITTKSGIDPETQTITWDVEYKPNLKRLYTDIDKVVEKLNKFDKSTNIPELEPLLKLGKSLRNRFSRLLKKYSDLKEQSATSQGGASFTPGTGAQYATPRAFKKNTNSKGTKNIYYYKLGWKPVPKKIKGSGIEVKKLYEGEAEDFQQESVDMTQFEDRRFRGPDGQLNVEGKTGLNLKNPYGYTAGGYGYAEGGAVEQGMEAAIARNSGVSSMVPDKGMADALARNEGIAYTPPAPVSTPVSTPVSAPNINVGGFSSAPTNLTGGLGALNVNSGTVGQSPDAKAAEDLRKTQVKMMNGYEVPIDFVPASPGSVIGGMGGRPQSHYYDNATSKWVKGQKPGSGSYGMGMGSGGIGNQYRSFSGYGGPAAGVAQYAEGGYLGGGDVNVQGDGMSDDIPANIDNEQPAALSEGEFVVPADVVSHIGNGSSEAGAKEFYGMMDRVRMARTGRKKQSPEIDPERFMPA